MNYLLILWQTIVFLQVTSPVLSVVYHQQQHLTQSKYLTSSSSGGSFKLLSPLLSPHAVRLHTARPLDVRHQALNSKVTKEQRKKRRISKQWNIASTTNYYTARQIMQNQNNVRKPVGVTELHKAQQEENDSNHLRDDKHMEENKNIFIDQDKKLITAINRNRVHETQFNNNKNSNNKTRLFSATQTIDKSSLSSTILSSIIENNRIINFTLSENAPMTETFLFSPLDSTFNKTQRIYPFGNRINGTLVLTNPPKIYGAGTESKFPPFLENLVSRIQHYFSVYKYEDQSRPSPNQPVKDSIDEEMVEGDEEIANTTDKISTTTTLSIIQSDEIDSQLNLTTLESVTADVASTTKRFDATDATIGAVTTINLGSASEDYIVIGPDDSD